MYLDSACLSDIHLNVVHALKLCHFEAQREIYLRINTAIATTKPSSSVSDRCPAPMPNCSHRALPRSDQMISGLPQALGTKPESRIHMPCEKPVPIAFTMASLAAKRIDKNRAGRLFCRNKTS